MYKDVSMSGGTTLTLTGDVDTPNLESELKAKIPDIDFRKLTELRTGQPLALIIESSLQPDQLKSEVEKILGYNLTDANSSTEFTGPALSASFYLELLKVVVISFILMGMVIFLIFGESRFIKALSIILSFCAVKLTFPGKPSISVMVLIIGISAVIYAVFKAKNKLDYTYLLISTLWIAVVFIFNIYSLIFLIGILLFALYFYNSIPSIAVILSAFSDIALPLVVVDLLGIKLSAAGIAAFLMLIGYSVDTDILLTTRALRGGEGEGNLNHRIYSAFKTGILMTSTALAAVLPIFFIVKGLPDSFMQIFLVLAIGLFADILNTWLTNASIIKWYCDKKGIK